MVMLKVISTLWKNEKIDNCLILAPKTVLSVWEKELADNLLTPWELVDSTSKPIKKEGKLVVCLQNYEALSKFKKSKIKKSYDLVICDESHRIKNRNSISCKVACKLGSFSNYKFCLSGTPMGNEEVDFYAQYKFLDPTIFGTYKEFDRKFFKKTGYMGYKRKFKSETHKKLFYKIVNEHSFRITKDECLKLLGKQETIIPVDLKCMKAYNKLERELRLLFENDKGERVEIEAPLAITLVTKLQQLCCGFIYDNEHNVIPQGDDSKIIEVRKLLKQFPERKFVIFCKYTWEIDNLAEELSRTHRVLVYDGRTRDKKIWTKLSTDYDILIAQIKSGGTGLNLQCASIVIFYSLPYSYIDVSQAKDRVYRNGQSQEVGIYYLLGRDTIEENIYNVVTKKLSGAQAILDDFRKTKLSP